ncbi:MAG: phosphoribosylanthranilate isomerase [Lentisphaeria bacterium]|nr:phosphoribosylanthranilate isomerase [Lentisphaeria bacterium]
MYLKICGITRFVDAELAIEQGVDALGFVAFPPSKRYVSPTQVKALVDQLRSSGLKLPELVAVMVNPTVEETEAYLTAGIDIIQLHGQESSTFVNALDCRCWKAFNIKSEEQIRALNEFDVEKFLIDSFVKGAKVPGGTGVVADWKLSKKAVEVLNKPVILAGGISPSNLTEAWKSVTPFGFDVSSSIEDEPGIKNQKKMKQLFEEFKLIKE